MSEEDRLSDGVFDRNMPECPHEAWAKPSDEASVEQRLREQGMSPNEARELAPALLRLSAWRAPASTASRRDQLVARLAEQLPVPADVHPATVSLRAWAAILATTVAATVAATVQETALHTLQAASAQARLLRPAVWIASATAIGLAVVYALAVPQLSAQDVLIFALPLVAGAGCAFLYGPEVDAGLELALATPTSPRTVLGLRFAQLFAFDATLALAGALLVAALHGESFWGLTLLWLAPMTFLAALSLTLSLLLGPAAAAGSAVMLSLSRIVRLSGFGLSFTLQSPTSGAWLAPPQLLLTAVALLLVALYTVPRITTLPQQEN